MIGWVSPRLGVRFELTEEEQQIYRPDSDHSLTFLELDPQRQQEREQDEQVEAKLEARHALLQERGINVDQL